MSGRGKRPDAEPGQLAFDLDGAAPEDAGSDVPPGAAPEEAGSEVPREEAPPGAVPLPLLPDADDREAIATALDENLLVEAGAGSGKTTELVNRMVALVATGTARVQEVAAVTFTRKAAGELRERFQARLERARTEAAPGGEEAGRLERALQDLDRAFMGTIHAFCARLLRERPLDAGLDPAFHETTAREADRLARRFWALHLERLSASDDPSLDELRRAGLRPQELYGLYLTLRDYPDVHFPAPDVEPPSREGVEAAKASLAALMDAADAIWPDVEPGKGWDNAQTRLRTAWFLRRTLGWGSDRVFFQALAPLCESQAKDVTLNRWEPKRSRQEPVKAFKERLDAFGAPGTPERATLDRWYAHRYAPALRFARRAAEALAEHRVTTGHLDFQDLLVLTAQLLRESPAARRDLGGRYRHLLVDEFQDTDPLQAEILFLLASEPGSPSWQDAVPRPGALFVVGDPKQSIYRFRRADISLYMQVRRRFRHFGRVLRLTANFRSGEAVGELVNAVFQGEGGFPAEADALQAEFAPLVSQRPRLQAHGRPPASREGVFLYDVEADTRRKADLFDWGADALARWIAGRLDPDAPPELRREAGDFLVLTRVKGPLERYARALERWGVPVQVSGAGVGVEDELAELRIVLEALADPDDPVLTVAALTGLFFGLDHQQLLDHRRSGLGFDLRTAKAGTGEPVEEALATLRRWWDASRRHPADLVVGALAAELGLLPFAAAGDLGAVRAGALAYALDAVRGAGLDGDTSLTGALEVLATALDEEEAEAPLEPGRSDVVRLMNLHKAKGLEGDVVVLAAPDGSTSREPDRLVWRDADGTALGWLLVTEERGWSSTVLARPLDWEQRAEAQRRFEAAEEVRLLYVAATRAADELVVARVPGREDRSPWSLLYPWMEDHAGVLALVPGDPPARPKLAVAPAELARRSAEAGDARATAAHPTFRFGTVTARTKGAAPADAPDSPPPDAPPDVTAPSSTGPGGFAWGSAVHGVLEAAARGADSQRLDAVGRTLLLELDRPTRDGEPTELDALMSTVRGVLASPLWTRAGAAPRRLAETPFALAWEGEGDDAPGATRPYLEGVVDLAFREPDGWVLVDYKTDVGTDPGFPARRLAYRAQLATYGEAWERLTGEPVKERLLLWTRTGAVEVV